MLPTRVSCRPHLRQGSCSFSGKFRDYPLHILGSAFRLPPREPHEAESGLRIDLKEAPHYPGSPQWQGRETSAGFHLKSSKHRGRAVGSATLAVDGRPVDISFEIAHHEDPATPGSSGSGVSVGVLDPQFVVLVEALARGRSASLNLFNAYGDLVSSWTFDVKMLRHIPAMLDGANWRCAGAAPMPPPPSTRAAPPVSRDPAFRAAAQREIKAIVEAARGPMWQSDDVAEMYKIYYAHAVSGNGCTTLVERIKPAYAGLPARTERVDIDWATVKSVSLDLKETSVVIGAPGISLGNSLVFAGLRAHDLRIAMDRLVRSCAAEGAPAR